VPSRGGHKADDEDDLKRGGREDEGHAAQKVNTGRNHRRSMDECRDRRRTSHGVREPYVERHLGALAHHAAEKEQADPSHRAGGDGRGLKRRRELDEADRAELPEAPDDADKEAEVAHPVHYERLLGGIARLVGQVVADEHVGAEADKLPEDEEHEEVLGNHDARHGEHEERESAEEAAARGVVVRITEGEKVDEEAHHRDDHEEQGRHLVKVEAEIDGEVAERQPREGCLIVLAVPAAEKQAEREQHLNAGGADGQGCGEASAPAAQKGDKRGGE